MSGAAATTGFKLEIGDGAAGFLEIKEIKDVPELGGEAPDIDVTHLASTAREYIPGIKDPGASTITCNRILDDPGQDECRTLNGTDTARPMKATLPTGEIAEFTAYIKNWVVSGGIDEAVSLAIGIRISGDITWSKV